MIVVRVSHLARVDYLCSPEHNHEPSDTPATHPSLRKPTIDELDIITSLTSLTNGYLRQNDPTTLLTRHWAGRRYTTIGRPQKHKSEQLGGLIPIEPLVKTSYWRWWLVSHWWLGSGLQHRVKGVRDHERSKDGKRDELDGYKARIYNIYRHAET